MTLAAPPADQAQPCRGLCRTTVLVLSVSQLVSYGAMFYALPVLATSIAGTEGWAMSSVLLAFSGGLGVAAVVGIWVGRHLDRRGPRLLMTAGSVTAAAGLAGVALSSTLAAFALCWLFLGSAMAATFNPAAFAAATGWAGNDVDARLQALTTITVVGGLASTVFAPLAALLEAQLGWRGAYLVLAAVVGSTTIPLHWWGLRRRWPVERAPRHSTWRPAIDRDETPLIDRTLMRLTVALSLGTLSLSAVVVTLAPMLESRGLSTSTAAVAVSLGGLGQVLGRIAYGRLHLSMGPRARTRLSLGLGGAATLALAVAWSVVALMVVGVLAGVARGLFTLVQATAVSDRWGQRGYGARNAMVSSGATAAVACAPAVAGCLLAVTGTYTLALLVLAVTAVAAGLLAPSEQAREPTPQSQPSRSRGECEGH